MKNNTVQCNVFIPLDICSVAIRVSLTYITEYNPIKIPVYQELPGTHYQTKPQDRDSTNPLTQSRGKKSIPKYVCVLQDLMRRIFWIKLANQARASFQCQQALRGTWTSGEGIGKQDVGQLSNFCFKLWVVHDKNVTATRIHFPGSSLIGCQIDTKGRTNRHRQRKMADVKLQQSTISGCREDTEAKFQ
jgi:hypothetical protein